MRSSGFLAALGGHVFDTVGQAVDGLTEPNRTGAWSLAEGGSANEPATDTPERHSPSFGLLIIGPWTAVDVTPESKRTMV
jgi:hypothetical protein